MSLAGLPTLIEPEPSEAATTALAAPRADALAALGPVLLLERGSTNAEDATCCCRWLAACCAGGGIVPRVKLDLGGVREELALLDGYGAVRLRVVRLPDSDFHGWERVLAFAGGWVEADPLRDEPGFGVEPAIQRAAWHRPRWRARPVRLQRTADAGRPLAALPLATCSCAAWRVLDALREVEAIDLV